MFDDKIDLNIILVENFFVETQKGWILMLISFWLYFVCLWWLFREWNCVWKRLKYKKKNHPIKSRKSSNSEAINLIFLIVSHIQNQLVHSFTMVKSLMEDHYCFIETMKDHKKKLRKYFLLTNKQKLLITLKLLFSENKP